MKPFEHQTADAIRNLKRVTVILSIATLAAMGGAALGFSRASDVASSNCRQIQRLQVVIRRVVVASSASLGKPGTGGYGYYRTHPQELAAAKVAALAEAQQFTPRSCD